MKKPIEEVDLVDEMNWEDCDKVEKISLEEAGLEEAPFTDEYVVGDKIFLQSIYAYLDWFHDGESSEFDRE